MLRKTGDLKIFIVLFYSLNILRSLSMIAFATNIVAIESENESVQYARKDVLDCHSRVMHDIMDAFDRNIKCSRT